MGYILWGLESCCCYELYFEQFNILDRYELLLGILSLGQTPLKMGKKLYWMESSVCLETEEQEKKNPWTTYFCLFISLKTNCGWEGGRNRLHFSVWTWEVKYFLFYAVLNKTHAFFADPKKSRFNWDKARKKSRYNKKTFCVETQNWQIMANLVLYKCCTWLILLFIKRGHATMI